MLMNVASGWVKRHLDRVGAGGRGAGDVGVPLLVGRLRARVALDVPHDRGGVEGGAVLERLARAQRDRDALEVLRVAVAGGQVGDVGAARGGRRVEQRAVQGLHHRQLRAEEPDGGPRVEGVEVPAADREGLRGVAGGAAT